MDVGVLCVQTNSTIGGISINGGIMEACSRICQGTTSDKTTKLNGSFFFAVSATMGISLQWWGNHLYKHEKSEAKLLSPGQRSPQDRLPMAPCESRHTKQHEGSDGHGIFGLDPQCRMSLLQECYLSHLGTTGSGHWMLQHCLRT